MAGFSITIAGDSALNLEFADTITPETSTMIRIAARALPKTPSRGQSTGADVLLAHGVLQSARNHVRRTVVSAARKLRGLDSGRCIREEDRADTGMLRRRVRPRHQNGGRPCASERRGGHRHSFLEGLPHRHARVPAGIRLSGRAPTSASIPRASPLRARSSKRDRSASAVRKRASTPCPSPGGWQIIGRTPIRPYDPDRRGADPLCRRRVPSLRAITPDEYSAIETQLSANAYEYQIILEGM